MMTPQQESQWRKEALERMTIPPAVWWYIAALAAAGALDISWHMLGVRWTIAFAAFLAIAGPGVAWLACKLEQRRTIKHLEQALAVDSLTERVIAFYDGKVQ